MVFRHVEQNADGWASARARDRSDRTTLPARRRAGSEGFERQHRHADIAAHLGVAAGALDQMRDQRGGGRFAVGAGDGDERALRAGFRALAAEQFDVADDLDFGLGGERRRSNAAPDG